jgi:hypothetical protein
VSRETLLPFRKVRVLKAVKSDGRLRATASIKDSNQYAFKVTGEVASRSIWDLAPVDRYVAPEDFLSGMARDVILRMGMPLTRETLASFSGQREVAVISTIPMPKLMELVGWETPGFTWRPVWSYAIDFRRPHVEVYQTIYYPDPSVPYYRASLTGNQMIVEFMEDPSDLPIETLNDVRKDFGLPDGIKGNFPSVAKRQEYGKLLPIAAETRHEFITAMTDQYNLYSVGRFATWRQILLDDVVQDVRKVEQMITQRSRYLRRLATVTA